MFSSWDLAAFILYALNLQKLKDFFARRTLPVSRMARFIERHHAFFDESATGLPFILPTFIENHDGNRYKRSKESFWIFFDLRMGA
jgi:hypothetical protein